MKKLTIFLIGLLAFGLAPHSSALNVSIDGPHYVCKDKDATYTAKPDCQSPVGEESYDWAGSGGNPLGPTTEESYHANFPTLGSQTITVDYKITDKDGKEYPASASTNIEVVKLDGNLESDATLENDGHVAAWLDPAYGAVNWENDEPVSYSKEQPVKITTSHDDNNFGVTVDPESGDGHIVVRAKNPYCADDFKEFTVPITGCECADCVEEGENENQNGCVHSIFHLGRGNKGLPAGRLQIISETPSLDLATPRALSIIAFDPQLEITRVTANGVSNVLRQVLAPKTFVDVLPISQFKYEIRFFRPDEAGPKGTNGFYNPSGLPFVSYAIENPAATTNDINTLRITQTRGSASVVYEYVYRETAGVGEWALSSGNGLKSDALSVVTNAMGRILTRTVKDAAGQVASKTRTTFRNFDWGAEIVERVEDPDGAALTTTRTYYDDDAVHPGQYGKLKQVNNPDGSWRRYDYDPKGREILEVSSWLNAPATAAPGVVRAVYSDYIPVDSQDDGSVLSHKPRTVEEKIAGITVAKTFAAYYFASNNPGERVEIEERAPSAVASYGAAGNLRTTRIYYPVSSGQPNSAQFKSISSSDGRFDSYFFEAGAYAGGTFTANPTGTFVRVSIVHGTVAHPNGIPFQTTEEVTINDRFGRALLQETSVCTGTSPENFERIAWTQFTLDEFGREITRESSNGARVDTAWACCGKESEKDESGIEQLYAYDALKRLVFSKKVGVSAGEYPAQADQITTYTYDAEGRRLTEVLSAGSLSQGRTNQYDLAGRLVNRSDFAGLATATAYSQDGLITTETLPGGVTRITERYKDGQVKTITGTAQVPQFYEYGINADGTRWTKVYSASSGSPVWVKTTTDLLGRPAKVEKPGYLTTEVMEYFYNNKGQLEKQFTVHGSQSTVVLYAYDEIGNQIRSGLDVNANGVLDLAGLDRITENETTYVQISGNWWQETVSRIYASDNSAAVITNSIIRRSTLSAPTLYAYDAFGNQTITTTTIDRDNKKVTQTTDVPDSSANIVSISVNGLLVNSQRSTLSAPMFYSYDALGRQTGATDPRLGTVTSHYDSHGWVAYTEDAAGHRTTFTYDPSTGRQLSKTDPLSNTTYFAFTALGEVEKTWGSAAYPVSYEYDAYNRRVKQHTYRNGLGWSGSTWPATPGDSDETTWTYQEATGLLLSKTDDAGKSVSYTYTGNSKLETRTWARTDATNSLVTTYTYNPAGDLTGLDYSSSPASPEPGGGGTPDVSFTYDRLGRQKTASSSVSAHTFAYSGLLLDTETIISSAGTNVIARSYDSLGRSSGFNLNSDYQVAYGYDTLGRFSSVSSSVSSASICGEYSYLPNSDLIETLSTDNGLLTTRSYEDHRNLLTQVKNQVDSETISQFDYVNDAGGRRILVKNSGTGFQPVGNAFNLYGYNTRSEVISAERFFGSDPQSPGAPVAGQNWDYDFDHIGNRTQTARDGDSEVYTANNLNQYTERTVPGVAQVAGTAAEEATVTINRPSISGITVEPVTRQGAYFHKKLVLDNSSRADVEEIAVLGVKASAGTNGLDIVSSYSGVVWAAQSPERFSYDDDGNQLSDALRRYEWDAENRLIAVTSSNVVDGSLTRVEFSYDYMSRRASKTVYVWNSDSWLLTSVSSFLYDGWNLIKEVCAATGKGTITDRYVWGLDLSGSLQGAGGIGGLLARYRSEQRYYDEQGMLLICHKPPGNPENEQTIRINESAWPAHQAHGDSLGACAGGSVSNSSFLYTFDGNGNVSELLGTVNSELRTVGHYEYSPFGETIVATGPEAQDNPFRFSTKYWDNELGLSYYGYRYYDPVTGRWLSRDPMGAWLNGNVGKITQLNNLYAFVLNNSVQNIDFLGLEITSVSYTPFPIGGLHGSIEAYDTSGNLVGQVQWPNSATATWGSVNLIHGARQQSVNAIVIGATSYSARPRGSVRLDFSANVDGIVNVSGVCCSKKIIVDWTVDVDASPGHDGLIYGKVGTTPTRNMQNDDGWFELDFSAGSASFSVMAMMAWDHTESSPESEFGNIQTSATVSCK